MSRLRQRVSHLRPNSLTHYSLISLLLVAAGSAFGLPAEPLDAASSAVTVEHRQAVIERMIEMLEERYVFPQVAKKCGAHLQAELEAGSFDQATEAEAFAEALTKAVQNISHDKHMRVRVRRPERVEVEKVNPMRAHAERLDRDRRRNFGFEKVERLEGNVGYIDLRYFAGPTEAREVAVAAMAFLRNVDALIYDMRKNGGGNPDMVRFVSSYLFDEPTHLNSLYWRQGDRLDEFWTLDEVPGRRLADVPVFVLTSERTFSGAEEFSYNLLTQKRATLIGETTGGGANPGGTMPIDDRFEIFIPTGRAINPITGTNWEGVGVEPHISVDADEAFDIALTKAQEAADQRRQNRDQALEAKWSGFERGQQQAEELAQSGQSKAAAQTLKTVLEQALVGDLVGEGDLNQLGYMYLQGGKSTLAIAAFEVNVVAFPESANVYDSLGEGQMEAGLNELAIGNYKKSLQLDPENKNAVSMLERLGVPAKSLQGPAKSESTRERP